MSTRVVIILAMLALGSAPGSAQPASLPADPEIAWVRSHARPVALEGDGFDDLAFLAPLLEGKRIVQLGENTHGTREHSLVKARLVRFLHQELGFGVLAFESAFYQCYDADRTAAQASARTTLRRCAYGVWHTEEVLPLFAYLRATRTTGRPLRLAGFDVQPIGSNKAGRPAFLAQAVAPADADRADRARLLDERFLEVYARGSRERRTWFRSADGQRMAEQYDDLATFLAGSRTASLSEASASVRERAMIAQRTAASMAWYIRQQSAPTTRAYVELRDRGMAENVIFLLDELFPDEKVIVWGHNFHLRHDNLAIPPRADMFPDAAARTMGSWIRERYGDRVYTIGLYAYRGRAAGNRGEVYEIEAAAPSSLEALLHEAGADALFVDLARAERGPGAAWIDRPITARHHGTTALSMVLRNQYDGILMVDVVTPRVMLD